MSSTDRALFSITLSGITYSPTAVDGDCVVDDNDDGVKDDDVEEDNDGDVERIADDGSIPAFTAVGVVDGRSMGVGDLTNAK